MARFLKQLGYGVFYLAVFAIVIFLVYVAFFRPAPPSPTTPESPVPEIPQPTFTFENLKTEVSGSEVRVTGVLKNESPQIAPEVIIKATISDKNGFELFSSETLQEDVRAFEERPFTVFFPRDRGLAEEVGEEFTKASYVLQ